MASDVVTVNVPVKYKKFDIPMAARMHLPPAPRQEGVRPLPEIPLDTLSNDAFVQLVEAWVDDMYRTHRQQRPPQAMADCARCA